MAERRILVTAALPYANGPIHVGHLVEYLQTDIWVRFQKLRGHRCIYLCADDTHGTAIMKSARQRGCSEEEFIALMSEAHQSDFAGFDILFENYGSTNSPENRAYCAEIWAALRRDGLIVERDVTDEERVNLFTDEARRYLQRHMPDTAAARYDQAAPLWQCWLGLARYWKKRGVGGE